MKKLIQKRIFQHAAFWMSFILLFLVIYGPVFHNFPWLFLSSMVMLPFTMVLVYLINYRILPAYLRKKQYFRLGMVLLLILAIEPLLIRMLVMVLSGEEITIKSLVDYNLLPFYFETGLIIFIAFSIKLFKLSIREKEEKSQLEKQKLKAELMALRSQLNAHFLFNTLNNLYGLALKKSDLTPRGILMLSEMLNFVLYECSAADYPLNRELEFIHSYIELEKLRYGNRLEISLDKELENTEPRIAPLLLFPFVENSFKHGTSKMIREVWIRIRIRTHEDTLTFEVENSRAPASRVKNTNEGGLGLENVKKRLEILYPKKHSLLIREEENSFSVCLNIQIRPAK